MRILLEATRQQGKRFQFISVDRKPLVIHIQRVRFDTAPKLNNYSTTTLVKKYLPSLDLFTEPVIFVLPSLSLNSSLVWRKDF